nr:sialidase family protein [Stackebrandtia nassauensis]
MSTPVPLGSARPARRWRLVLLLAVLLAGSVLVGVGGADAQPTDAPRSEDTVAAAERQLLRDGVGLYPRAVRLEHNGDANGRVVAGVVSFVGNGDGIGAIYESTDDGATFAEVGQVADPDAAGGQGLCCATLFELPRQVGDMRAGTLLWAASVGADEPDRRMSLRIWRSDDLGRTWSHLSACATAPDAKGLWEPEFSVAADGALVCHYADETDPAHSQKLMHARSADGVTWTDHSPTVASTLASDRPGMPVVRQLPNGTYFMSFEICAPDGQFACVTHYRTSADGWDWGDPAHLGFQPETADGKYFKHAPTITWKADPDSPNGARLFLIGQILFNADGSVAAENGAAVLTNSQGGSGPWELIPSPVAVNAPSNNYCPNYSSTLLPTGDGNALFGIATDYENDVCKPFYGTSAP